MHEGITVARLCVHRALQGQLPDGVLVSIDTFRAEVARATVEAGAHMVNDVTGGTGALERDMHATVAALGVPYCLMHMRGTPQTMDAHAKYDDVVAEVAAELRTGATAAWRAGVCPWSVVLDPGLGFAKNAQQSVTLLRNLWRLRSLVGGPWARQPLLVGPSRKRFLGELTGRAAADRDMATAAACALSVQHGANVLRAHNPACVVDAARVADALVAWY